jgi:hypothetical protein
MRNLVIVMAGDDSLHEAYAVHRDFDLWVCYWGSDDRIAERFAETCDQLFRAKGQKWALVRQIGREARERRSPPFSGYGYVFLPDDDIAFPGGASAIYRAFALARDIGADIFQPAVANENYSPAWDATRQIPGSVCHATNLAEIMMPGYSGEIFERCALPLLHTHSYLNVGWGLEPLVARFAEAHLGRPVRTFVLDDAPAIHTRPVGQGSASHRVGEDEAFLNPFTGAVRIRELARFDSIADAAGFSFPAADDFIDWGAVKTHLKRVRKARLVGRASETRGIESYFLKKLQKRAVRRSKD